MASPNKPAIVLVPGAWHHPSQYIPLTTRLKKAGYEISAIDLPSTGGPKPSGLENDIKAIREVIIPYLDSGKNVVLLCHSFAGITGSAAVQNLRPEDRNGGAGVIKLIFLSAIIVPENTYALEGSGGQHMPQIIFPLPERENEGFCGITDPAKTFYNCCTPEVAEENVKKLRLFSNKPARDVVPYAGWKDIGSYYLICERDNIFPVFLQEAWSSSEGGKWKKVERMDTDHSPALSRPDETAEYILRCIDDV